MNKRTIRSNSGFNSTPHALVDVANPSNKFHKIEKIISPSTKISIETILNPSNKIQQIEMLNQMNQFLKASVE